MLLRRRMYLISTIGRKIRKIKLLKIIFASHSPNRVCFERNCWFHTQVFLFILIVESFVLYTYIAQTTFKFTSVSNNNFFCYNLQRHFIIIINNLKVIFDLTSLQVFKQNMWALTCDPVINGPWHGKKFIFSL